MLRVKKFGSGAVQDPAAARHIVERVSVDYETGDDVVCVISAMDELTDLLKARARAIMKTPPRREMDMLLTTGEQAAAALIAMAFAARGYRAVSLNAFQAGIRTTNRYGSARMKNIDTTRILDELGDRKIVVLTGFQGVNQYDDYTTLGKDGADITAIELAGALGADSCEIYAETDGVYTADPAICPAARVLRDMTYEELMDLSTAYGNIVSPLCVEAARAYGVPLIIRPFEKDTDGTIVRRERKLEKAPISGVALDDKIGRISVLGLKDEPGVAYRLFDTMAKAGVNVDQILQSLGHDGAEDISFTCPETETEKAVATLENSRERLSFQRILVDKGSAKVFVTGAGMVDRPGVAARLFEALYNEKINISMISTSEFRITCLISREDGAKAVNAIHHAFGLERGLT